jgi:hypothetical protein
MQALGWSYNRSVKYKDAGIEMKPIRVLATPAVEILPFVQMAYESPDFEHITELTLDNAIRRLDEPFDMIACSVHFNSGNFYDFLQAAKSHSIAQSIPFLVIHTGREIHMDYIAHSVDIASRTLGADAVIPLSKWRSELGDEAAFRKYREVVRKLVGR